MAIRGSTGMLAQQQIIQAVVILMKAMESLYRQSRVEYMNRRMENLYRTDSLTGINNRIGYQREGKSFFHIMNAKGRKVLILYIGLERLKYINEHFGHQSGDIAILSVARAMTESSEDGAMTARIGGSEFILMQEYEDAEVTHDLIREIRRRLKERAEDGQLPFEISVSIGMAVTEPNSRLPLEEYVKQADSKMGGEKQRSRQMRKDSYVDIDAE